MKANKGGKRGTREAAVASSAVVVPVAANDAGRAGVREVGESERRPAPGTKIEQAVAALVRRLELASDKPSLLKLGELQRPGDGRCIYTLEHRGHVVVRANGRGDFLDALEVYEAGWLAGFEAFTTRPVKTTFTVEER